jgi:CubicO group peptidase (beta-lactamase class C family)
MLAAGCVAAQQSLSARLDSLLSTKNVREFSGVVLIVQNGKPLYSKSIGYANRETKQPISPDSRFTVMSISKQITAVMVLQEVDKGHIQLQKTLRTYLPALKDKWADSITIHQLLNHTAGVVWYDQPLAFSPGTKLAYSNFGYVLLQSLLEHVTGKAYSVLLNDLFKKTAMPYSGVPPRAKAITGYAENKDGKLNAKNEPIPEMVLGAGGVVSTAPDLVRWNEQLHGGKLLRDGTYQAMITVYQPRQHPVVGQTGGGYGLMVNDSKSEIGHTGFLPDQGFIGINFYYPATHSSIVVLENIAVDPANMDRAYYFEKMIREIALPVVKGK